MKLTQAIILALFSTLLSNASTGQIPRDQDLVTLKNGYQILGYVVEQEPGKLIRIYRPDENDTVVAHMNEISKLTKIWVQTYSDKKIEEPQVDSITFGRFNNKKNVFAVTYTLQLRDIERNARKGVGLAYYRNFNNKYLSGVSTYFFSKQDPGPVYADSRATKAQGHFVQYQFLLENKIRLSGKQQNKRVTTLLSLNTGVVADLSHNTYETSDDPIDVEYEKFSGGFLFQTGLAFRVNPDNNSGFIIEPGFTYFAQNVKEYTSKPGDATSTYLGHHRQVNSLATLKLSYFF